MKYEIRILSDFARGQRSDYYVESKNGKEAIFDKDGKQISPEWFDEILKYGLVEGKSDYYIAKKNGKYAVFDKNGRMVSPEWFDVIYLPGLIKGQSDYYIARKNNEEAIFDKDGNQISQWFYWIVTEGFIKGKIDYYIACNKYTCAVYHKNGQKVSNDFPKGYIDLTKNITFNDRLGIVEITEENGRIVKSIEFTPVIKEEFLDYTKLLNI
jgi:hypothetical protein